MLDYYNQMIIVCLSGAVPSSHRLLADSRHWRPFQDIAGVTPDGCVGTTNSVLRKHARVAGAGWQVTPFPVRTGRGVTICAHLRRARECHKRYGWSVGSSFTRSRLPSKRLPYGKLDARGRGPLDGRTGEDCSWRDAETPECAVGSCQ